MEKFSFNTFSELYKACITQLDPAGTILIYKDKKITTEEFINTVKKYTLYFREIGIKKGSRVGLCFSDCPEIFYLCIALSLSGACAVPIHEQLSASHKLSILRLCDAHIFISESGDLAGFKAELEKNTYPCSLVTLNKNKESDYSINEIMPDPTGQEYPGIIPDENDALIVLSSTGTSGTPKFIEITQRNMVNVVKAAEYYMVPTDDFKNGYKMLSAFPMSTSAILIFMALIFLGITIIILDDFSPVRFLSLIEQWKVDSIAATPAYYETLINLPVIKKYKTDSIKSFYTGMDYISNKRLLKIKDHFKNTKVAGINYGLTETSTVVMIWMALKEKDFCVPAHYMTPVPGIDNEIDVITTGGKIADIGEQGEIIIKGQNVVKGYYKNPRETEKAFSKDGWFHTGDLGCKDEAGRIHLLGRLKDVIKRGGRSISPVVINNHLLKYHGVESSAVVGVPHTMYGEMIWAFIKKAGDQSIAQGDLMKHCRGGLPPYMVPDYISFIDRIPKKPGIGKINNEELITIALKELRKISGGINEK